MASENREIIQTNGLSASDLCLANSWNIVKCKTDNRLVHWEAARVAIAKLKSQGFFCIQDASAPDSLEFLWHLLTFCYAKKILGSERIVQWLRKEHWLPIKPTERCLLAQDLRRFRQNNRKILMLSLRFVSVIISSPLFDCVVYSAFGRRLWETSSRVQADCQFQAEQITRVPARSPERNRES